MSAPAPTSPPAPSSNSTSPPPLPPAASPPAPVTTSPPPANPPPSTPPPTASPPPSSSPPPPTTPAPASSPPPPNSTTPVTPSTPPPSGSTTPAAPSGNVSPPPPGATPSTPSTGNPSPSKGSLSPPSSSTPSQSNNGSSPGNGASTGMVVGIAIAGVAALLVIILIVVCCKKKRRRQNGPVDYYTPPPPGQKVEPYGGPVQHWQQNAPPPNDHVVAIPPKLPPPPGGVARPPHSPVRPPAAAPAPASYVSSSGSGSIYSGSETPLPPPSPGMVFAFSKNTFTYEELSMATDGFSEANLLGQGGFGYVHRGVLPNGKEVAVKQLKAGSGQGEREFHAEVEIISRVHHKHLVSLVGYCTTGLQRMLVYEFVPNYTLEFHLHGKGRPPLDWSTRLKIALGSAKGLAYLHEDCHPKIIHRDIKAANILLDFNFEAKVADFGLAKFTSDANTHVSTRVMGTFGYLAPEYASSGKLSEKSDIYSFGVVLLELLTGHRPVDTHNSYMDDSLVDWARPLLTRALDDENFDALIDTRLGSDYDKNEVARMAACAAASVRHSARRRPKMSQIVRALEGDVSLADLNEGVAPGHSTIYSSHGSEDYDTAQHRENMRKFRNLALASKDYTNSEYSGATSEYGKHPSDSSSEGQTTREMEMGKMKKDSRGFSGSS